MAAFFMDIDSTYFHPVPFQDVHVDTAAEMTDKTVLREPGLLMFFLTSTAKTSP